MRAEDTGGVEIGGRLLVGEELKGLYVERLNLIFVTAFDTKDWTDNVLESLVGLCREELEVMRAKARGEIP